jgi:hypothetical protein
LEEVMAKKGVLLVIVCLTFSLVPLASGSVANVVVGKTIDKADECGFVVDQAGLPVGDATLTASAGDFKVSATSSGDGSFLFPETSKQAMSIQAGAKGFSGAGGTVTHLEAAGEKRCRHPFYVVLFAANGGRESFLTVKKKDVPKPVGRRGR